MHINTCTVFVDSLELVGKIAPVHDGSPSDYLLVGDPILKPCKLVKYFSLSVAKTSFSLSFLCVLKKRNLQFRKSPAIKLEKKKTGQAWQQDNVTIELVEIERLGWFIEIEKLLEDNASEREVTRAVSSLATIRKELGLGDYPLEGRYYSEMLQEL